MFLTVALVLAACWLIARQASGHAKQPQELLAAFALSLFALFWHFSGSGAAWRAIAELLLIGGIGLILASGYIKRRGDGARPFFSIGLLFLLVSVLVFGAARLLSAPGSDSMAAGDRNSVLLVELGPDDRLDELAGLFERHDATAARAFENVTPDENVDLAQVWIVTVPSSRASGLAEALDLDDENVDHVEANRIVSLDEPLAADASIETPSEVIENDPLVSRQWALDAIGAHEAHALLQDRTPVRRARLAIVDTGVDARHEDLAAAFQASPGSADPHGHGSHCAGIAGSVTNNGVGIASLNWEGRYVEIRGYTALNAMGSGSVEQIAQAVIDAAEDRSDIISMSLGDRSPVAPKTIRDAIAYARSLGAVIVVSAGNSNEDAALHMPSNVDGVIVVSALDRQLRKAGFSNTNTSLALPIAAPGVDILSARPGGGYVPMSGTSMATPMVAGVLGILKALDPDLGEAELYEVIRSTARKVPDADRTGLMIDAGAAVQRVLDGRSL